MYKEIIIETKVYDLDWNRHVTSRAYENYGYAGRLDILQAIGLSIDELLKLKYKIIPCDTSVRFMAQQFSDVRLKVRTSAFQDSSKLIHWNQLIEDMSGNAVCELRSSSMIVDDANCSVSIQDLYWEGDLQSNLGSSNKSDTNSLEYHKLDIHLNPLPIELKPLVHSWNIPFSDLNIFWLLSSVSIWKYFEEGRFLFFKEVLGFGQTQDIDITTFFMNAKIQIYELPEAGSKLILESWIDSVEKIRFYFRQDIKNSDGKILASMKDEQLFVKLSNSRPCKVPQEFLEKTKNYRIETKN